MHFCGDIMKTQLTLWPMPIVIIPMCDRNDWLIGMDVHSMSREDLLSYLNDLEHDYKQSIDCEWINELHEAILHIKQIIGTS